MNIFQGINWNEILYGGFALSVIKLVWDVFKFLKLRKSKKDEDVPDVNMEQLFDALLTDSIHVQDLLSEFSDTTNLPRVLVIKAESKDEDKILSTNNLESDTTLSILYETINPTYIDRFEPLKKDIQDHVITADHKALLYDLIRKLEIEVDPNETTVKIIKQICEVDNIERKYMYLIDTIKGVGIIYLVIHSDKIHKKERKAEIYYKTTIVVQKVKDLFEKIYGTKSELLKNI